jgi:hypothetical protein
LLFLAVRSIFTFGPPALITAYFFRNILENRTQKNLTEYLKQKEKIEAAKISVTANAIHFQQMPQDA